MTSRIVAFWAVLMLSLAAIGFPLVLASSKEASEQHIDITNESFTPDGHVTLNDSNIGYAEYDAAVAVYNGSDVRMAESGNYTWYQGNGTLAVTANSTLDNSSDATITYGYEAQTKQQRAFSLAIGRIGKIWTLLPLLLGVLLVVMLILGMRGLA